MKYKLIETTIERDGEKIIQGRSREGKLLVEKTREGYELKCPRSKEVYLITYEEMLSEYKKVWQEGSSMKDFNPIEENPRMKPYSGDERRKERN